MNTLNEVAKPTAAIAVPSAREPQVSPIALVSSFHADSFQMPKAKPLAIAVTTIGIPQQAQLEDIHQAQFDAHQDDA
ncbi:MAG: hypothetical protein C4336_07370 [Armatimonadota bacterium]